MQVRPERPVPTAALEPRRAVVPEAVDHPAERLGSGVEKRPADVVLESGEDPALAGNELAVEQTSPIMRSSPASVSCGKRPAPGMNEPSRPR